MWHLVIIVALFGLTIQLWLIPHILGYLISLVFGLVTVPILAYFTIKYSVKALSRVLIASSDSKEETLATSIDIGLALTNLYVGGVLLSFVLNWVVVYYGLAEDRSVK